MSVAARLMAVSISSCVRKIARTEPRFDIIDAHYFYPDGVAAALIARELGLPLVITARGTDVNLIPQYSIPRRQIVWAARQASAIVTVAEALRRELVTLGVDPSKITTLRNGYDPELFHAIDRYRARAELGISGRTLLSVGHLIERKGHHLTIEALSTVPDVNLVIVGSGSMEEKLRALARGLGLSDRVRFEGTVQQARLKAYYSACDALVLASSREGMANVLIESIACGCPVIATNSWGSPEVIGSKIAGVLVGERSVRGLANGIRELFADLPDRHTTEAYARQFGWEPTSRGQFELFRSVIERSNARSSN
jgi:glycosyltransferase involved in cell wall biosynthesis